MKNKFQTVDFKTVDDFLEFIPENELKIVSCLRQIIFSCVPECTEKLAYNVPFYFKHSRFCFIWPPSVQWGNTKHNGVRLGFTNGYLLTDDSNYLDKGERKQMYWKDFKNVKDIEIDLIKSFLFEAIEIDERLKKLKKKK
jgi:hypothetical protein